MVSQLAMRRTLCMGFAAMMASTALNARSAPTAAAPTTAAPTAAAPLTGTPFAIAAAQTAVSDSAAVHARAMLAISEFFLEWQQLWRASAVIRATVSPDSAARTVRLPYLHCHPDAPTGVRRAGTGGGEGFAREFAQFSLLGSDHSSFATCPSWILSDYVLDAGDERLTRDGALIEALRPAARSARARLLAALDNAASLAPSSGFLTGQRVRFRLEHRDIDSAHRIARDCQAARWWCLALLGYVLERRGAWVDAEFTYGAMYEAMPAAMRCAWQDVSALLAPSGQSAYDKLSCDARVTVNRTLWWLSDPLFRVQGNERWTTQQSRLVDIALRTTLDSDERYVWDADRGGDAMARLIVRYDWPSYTWWDSRLTDEGHSSYLRSKASPPAAPYSTFEYSLDRVHLLPTWTAVANPLSAQTADWDLAPVTADGNTDRRWWPVEHFQTPRRLVQLPEGQTVLFRRDRQIGVASAHRLRQPLLRREGQRFDVMLLASRSPNAVDTLAQRIADGGATVVLRGMIDSGATLLAVEAMGVDSSALDARTRFGVTPPPTLLAMSRGDIAVSEPALLDAESGAGSQDVTPDAMLDHLLGSLTLEKTNRRLGVYWETYGIAAQDTVTITVSMQGDANVGGLRRLGMALNVVSDPNRSLSIRWTEPSPQHYTRTIPGALPVQVRSLMLNIASLAPGPYLLRISVERPGRPAAVSQQRVVLEP